MSVAAVNGNLSVRAVADTTRMEWAPIPGVSHKALYQQAGFSDLMRLERWQPKADLGVISYARGAELFVLEGEFSDEAGAYAAGCWLRLPAGSQHHRRSAAGCTLYVKRSGLPYLRSAANIDQVSAAGSSGRPSRGR